MSGTIGSIISVVVFFGLFMFVGWLIDEWEGVLKWGLAATLIGGPIAMLVIGILGLAHAKIPWSVPYYGNALMVAFGTIIVAVMVGFGAGYIADEFFCMDYYIYSAIIAPIILLEIAGIVVGTISYITHEWHLSRAADISIISVSVIAIILEIVIPLVIYFLEERNCHYYGNYYNNHSDEDDDYEEDYDSDYEEDEEEQSYEEDIPVVKKSKSKTLDLSIKKLDNFDEFFSDKIIGQDEVLYKIKEHLIMLTYDLNKGKGNRPAGIFFFAGPTGVGKTEVCKNLSEFLYDNKNINRFDMSEYKSDVAIQKLIGAPNGYVGYEEGGVLTNTMKKNPNAIVLFDEIEKADRTVFDIFLQILDEGIVTSNKGEKVSFKNNIIIFTSNLGASLISKNMKKEQVEISVKEAIDDFFTNELNRPEILGRIGKENIITFNMIKNKTDLYKILDIHFNKFIQELSDKKIGIKFNKKSVYDAILLDVDITKGARDIRNEFEQFKKHFTMGLYKNKIDLEKMKNKTISFEYDNVKVDLQVL